LLKLAIISDIHHAPPGPDGFDVRQVVDAFVSKAIVDQAEVLIDLGDRIDDIDRETDLRLSADLADIFKRFSGPRVHLRGNHDVVNLTDLDHERLFGQRPGHSVLDLGTCRLVLWEPSVTFNRKAGFPPAAGELEWLTATLSADSRPAIVATHIPLSGASMTSNYYFENNAAFATYPDAAAVRAGVEATGNAALWLSGHVHWNSLAVVGNVPHVTIQSASERFTTMPNPACTFAQLEISDNWATLEVVGRDPLRIEFPFGRSGDQPWPEPRPKVV
jgi:hypothetical protein